MSVSRLPRVLRVVYPATVFTAVLLSWSSAGLGVESALLFQKKPEFNFNLAAASTDTASCKTQDRLRLPWSRQTCPGDELSGSWLGEKKAQASQFTKRMESHSASVN